MRATNPDEPLDQIHAMSELAELANYNGTLSEFNGHVVDLIVKHLRFEHAAVFLLKETEDFVVLHAASGAIQQLQNLSDFRLPVDFDSLVGWVAAQNQPRVIADANHESPFTKSDLFPSVSCEAGVPISLNGRLLGVLHVQHDHVEAFDTDALLTLQAIANMIATFVSNYKLLEATQDQLRRNALLLDNSRQQAERERIASEIIAKLWSSTDIQTILRTAIYELCRSLEADDGMIQLHLPESLQLSTAPAYNGHKGGTA
jgi:GAF domain-containing protein